jgi:hypothetical protein
MRTRAAIRDLSQRCALHRFIFATFPRCSTASVPSHVGCRLLHVACFPLSAACCPLHVVRCMLSVACCMLHVACCMLHVARCLLPAACCPLRAACSGARRMVAVVRRMVGWRLTWRRQQNNQSIQYELWEAERADGSIVVRDITCGYVRGRAAPACTHACVLHARVRACVRACVHSGKARVRVRLCVRACVLSLLQCLFACVCVSVSGFAFIPRDGRPFAATARLISSSTWLRRVQAHCPYPYVHNSYGKPHCPYPYVPSSGVQRLVRQQARPVLHARRHHGADHHDGAMQRSATDCTATQPPVQPWRPRCTTTRTCKRIIRTSECTIRTGSLITRTLNCITRTGSPHYSYP